jgi:hypothetical protein
MSRLGPVTVLFSFGLLTWLACDEGPTEPRAQAEVTQQLAQGGQGKGPKVSEVAFFASLANSTTPTLYSVHQVSFDNVLLNLGEAYDPATGFFTAPTDGVYQLDVHTSIGGLDWARLSKNGTGWIYTWHHEFAPDKNASAVTVPLQQGDAIAVEVRPIGGLSVLHGASEVNGAHLTYFSGHLVTAQ